MNPFQTSLTLSCSIFFFGHRGCLVVLSWNAKGERRRLATLNVPSPRVALHCCVLYQIAARRGIGERARELSMAAEYSVDGLDR